MEKITKREMYEALVNLATTGKMEFLREDEVIGVTEDTLAEFATHEIEQLDKKAEKAKAYAEKRKNVSDDLMDAVRVVLNEDEFITTPDILVMIEDESATAGKVQARLRKLVDNGEAEKQEVSVPATESSKARRIMGYRLVSTSENQ